MSPFNDPVLGICCTWGVSHRSVHFRSSHCVYIPAAFKCLGSSPSIDQSIHWAAKSLIKRLSLKSVFLRGRRPLSALLSMSPALPPPHRLFLYTVPAGRFFYTTVRVLIMLQLISIPTQIRSSLSAGTLA